MKRLSIITVLLIAALPGGADASPLPVPLGFHARGQGKSSLIPVRWAAPKSPPTPSSRMDRGAPKFKTLRVAQASPEAKQAKQTKQAKQAKQAPSPPTGERAPAQQRSQLVPIGGQCVEDEQCVKGAWCADSTKRCVELQTPINVLYLFYRSGDRRFTEVLGLFWRKTGSRGYNVLFPFYWHFYDKPRQRTSRVVFPFYWRFDDERAKTLSVWVPPFQYRRAPDEKNYRLWPLLFWTDYGEKGAGLTILPLFHRSWRGTYTSTIVPLLLSGYASDPAKHFSRGLVAGLYYWHRKGKPRSAERERTDAVFPFFYHSSKADRRFTWVFPFNVYRRDERSRSLWLLPLLYHYSSERSAQTISLLPPFLYRRQGNSTRLFLPLFLYENDRDAQVKHWGLFVPPYYHRRDDEREIDTLIPLFWRWHDKVERKTTWIAGPLIARSDPEGGTYVLFPIFWRFSDQNSGASTALLFPLAYRHTRPGGGQFNMLFPFYAGWSKRDWGAGILPLLYFGAGEGRRHGVLFPLFWHFKSPEASTTVLATLYFRSEQRGWLAGLAPLLFLGHRGGHSHQVLFPIFWHLRSTKDDHDTWVAGPFFHHSTKAHGRLTGFFPLFLDGNWKGQRFTVAPLFYRRRDLKTNENVLLAGPYWSYRRRVAGKAEHWETGHHLIPLALYRATHDQRGQRQRLQAGVLPLFYYDTSPKKTLLLTPLGGYRRDDTRGLRQGLFGPVVWHDSPTSKAFAVAPLFMRFTDKKAKATTTLALPFAVHYRSPRQRSLVVFPFYWRIDYRNERNMVVFPFFWQTREKKDGFGADVVFPLYWRVWDNKSNTTVAGPLFWYQRDGGKRAGWGAIPLALYRKTARSSWLFSLPFFWYDHDFVSGRKTYVAGPAYFRRYGVGDHDEDTDEDDAEAKKAAKKNAEKKNAEKKNAEKKNAKKKNAKKAKSARPSDEGYAAGLLPLFYHKRTPKRRYTLLFPLVWYFARPKKQESLLIAGPYFSHGSKERRGLGLFPLFYRSITRQGESALGVFPLFYRASGPLRSALYTPLFGWDNSPERRHLYVGPYFRTRGGDVDRDIVFPLLYRSKDKKTGTHRVFALPGYYGSWRRGSSVHIAFPLFWQWKGVDWARTVVFPLFWDFNDRHARRTTVVVPLFARDRDTTANSVSWYTLPSIWVRQRPKATDVVVFPLFWHFGGQKESSTVAFPLYWDFKRARKRSTVFFPLFWRFDRPQARTYVVVNTYYRRQKRDDTYDFWFVPLFRMQRPRPGDINVEVLLGMFGYKRVGRNRILTLLFLPITLEAAKGKPAPAKAPPGTRPSSPAGGEGSNKKPRAK